MKLVFLLTFICVIEIDDVTSLNDRPTIGILSQEMLPGFPVSYIASSYVKWVEAAGARAVPIIVDSEEDFVQLFGYINGLLIPGGGVSLDKSPYSRVSALMLDMAMSAYDEGEYFPIWGTCLGFELLAFLTNDEVPNLTKCHGNDLALPLVPTKNFTNSRVLIEADQKMLDNLTNMNVTANYHNWCLTTESFNQNNMDTFWEVISTNQDEDGLEFVSMIEAKDYPFYGVQFHPEKNNYEWAPQKNIPHSREAVKISNYMADFFVQEARKSTHTFPNRDVEKKHLIYNWPPLYSGGLSYSVFEQLYIFPGTNNSTEML